MLEWKNIHLDFDGKSVLRNFSLTIRAGEKVLLQGRSGRGKTTLFHLLLGFITPSQGNFLFQNQPLTPKNVRYVRQQTMLVDQDSSLGEGSLRNWFETVLGFQANAAKIIPFANVLPLMHTLELDTKLLNKDISLLSGGERQRAAIVTALLLDRDVFLLDEPTSSVDTRLKNKIISLFTQHPDWTVVVISHDDIWKKNPSIRAVNLEALT